MLSKFIEENYTSLQRYLKRRFKDLNAYDAEDIIQQTLVKLLSKGRNDINVVSVSSYIYTSIQNNALDYFRKSKRIVLVDTDIPQLTDSVEDEVLLNELDEIIQSAIDSLDDKSKYIFIETELKGRTYEDLVDETGEKLGTLLSRKSRAKKKLKSAIEVYMEVEKL